MSKSKRNEAATTTTPTPATTGSAPRKSSTRVLHEDRARFEAETAELGVAVRWEADELGQQRALAVNKLNEW